MKDPSNYPAEIIQHILSYCTMKEAAKTSVLCKNFHSAYSTRPILKFNEGELSQPENIDPTLFNPNPLFLNHVSKTLNNYQCQMISIDEVCFRMYESSDTPKIKNQWIEAVVKCSVQKMTFLGIYGRICLPPSIYEAKSLKELDLYKCVLKEPIGGNIMFVHLKKLSLSRVKFGDNELLEKILRACLMVEELDIYKCSPIKKISLGKDFKDLKKVIVFMVYDKDVHLDLHVPNRIVDLSLMGVTLPQMFLDNFGEKFPYLEKFNLGNCWDLQKRICFSSESVRSLVLGLGLDEVDVDLPHLVDFTYWGGDIPSLSLKTTSEKVSSELVIRCKEKIKMVISLVCLDCLIDSSWFLSLRQLLKESLHVSKYSLNFLLRSLVRIEEVTHFQHEPVIGIDQLTLDIMSGELLPYLGLLLDGFLLVCRPNVITIVDGCTWLGRIEIANSMLNLLMGRKGIVFSGDSHQLQGVEVVAYNNFGDIIPMDSMDAINDDGICGRIIFKLEWKKLPTEQSRSQGTWKRL